MCRFEVTQVDQIALSTDRPLHSDQVSERADRSLDAVDEPDIGPFEKQIETNSRHLLGHEIQITVRSRKMNRALAGDRCVGDRGTIGACGVPFSDQAGDALDVA